MIILTRFNLLLLIIIQAGTIAETRGRTKRGFVLSREDLKHYTSDPAIEDYDFTRPDYIEPESMISKRSVDSKPVTFPQREVKFKAFGQAYHVRLQPNNWLLRPGLVVERVGADGSITVEDIPSRDCFYYTHLLSHPGESAGALSTCDGLRGMISHNDSDIYISPLKDHHASRYRREIETEDEFYEERPHLVYKRSSERGQRTSDTTSTASSSFDYDHHGEDSNDADGDTEDGHKEEDISYSYNETSQFGRNNTYNNGTFCETYILEDDDVDPAPQPSHSWEHSYQEEGNVSDPWPMYADMAAGQEEGEHEQEWGDRYIEMFLVLDDKMNSFHGEDIMNYTLALMNIVSMRYAEPSLLSEVRLSLVKIVVAEEQNLTMTGLDGVNYNLNLHAEGYELVKELCAWQIHFNPESDDNPLHYDSATLLTRKDLWKWNTGWFGKYKDTGLLGRAPLGTICNRYKSCNINEENGLEAALTVTHELGHNLKLLHDPDYGCTNGVHIMSSMSTTGPNSFKWSSCSAEHFTAFLKTSKSTCLQDKPLPDQLVPNDQLAGTQYTRLEQCQKAYGHHITELCVGERTYVPCPDITNPEKSRDQDCARSNSIKFKWGYHQWFFPNDGLIMGDKLCQLRCKTRRGYNVIRPPNFVTPGTRCWNNDDGDEDELQRTKICVENKCKEIGCDGVYASGKLLDGCGKCEGSGRTCRHVKGILWNRIGIAPHYIDWVTIPAGSTMINITNTKLAKQLIALSIDGKDIWRPRYDSLARAEFYRYVVGDIHIMHTGEWRVWEKIWVLSGPTSKAIKLDIKQDMFPMWVLPLPEFRRKPTLLYEWYEPISDPVSYYWELHPASACSMTCGGGTQTVTATCIEEINGEKVDISDRFCADTVKPVSAECNTEVCSYGANPMWVPGDWSNCSVTCGDGIKTRNLSCIDSSTMASIAKDNCISRATNVASTTTCSNPACPSTQGPTVEPGDADDISFTVLASEVAATVDADVTIEVTTSSDDLATQPPPFIAIPPKSGCDSYGTPSLLFTITVSVLVLLFQLHM